MADSDQSGKEAVAAIGGATLAGAAIGTAIAGPAGTVIGAGLGAILSGTAVIVGEVRKR